MATSVEAAKKINTEENEMGFVDEFVLVNSCNKEKKSFPWFCYTGNGSWLLPLQE